MPIRVMQISGLKVTRGKGKSFREKRETVTPGQVAEEKARVVLRSDRDGGRRVGLPGGR